MQELGFKKEKTVGRFLDPFNNFQEKQIEFEVRYDEISGVVSRILPFRFRITTKPDINSYLEQSPASLCPFCSGLLEKVTPKFTPDVIPAGKFQRGSACLFPNAFPYDRSNNVAIFSAKHFVPLQELTAEYMQNGFRVCGDYFHRMAEMNRGYAYCSINWNYMPPSGAGMVHPHLQTLAGLNPTTHMQRLLSSARNYAETSGGNLWRNLIVLEKEAEERFIASTGTISWLASFAPKGMAGEVDFIFREKTSFFELTEANFDELLSGLVKVFNYLYLNNVVSFNMSLYAPLIPEKNFWVQGKIVPRFQLHPLETSDINFLEKLHDEIICPIVPEELCRELQPYFL